MTLSNKVRRLKNKNIEVKYVTKLSRAVDLGGDSLWVFTDNIKTMTVATLMFLSIRLNPREQPIGNNDSGSSMFGRINIYYKNLYALVVKTHKSFSQAMSSTNYLY